MQNLITDHLDIWTAAHKTRSTAGRGSNNKLDLIGIKKLRELILELAAQVRGGFWVLWVKYQNGLLSCLDSVGNHSSLILLYKSLPHKIVIV